MRPVARGRTLRIERVVEQGDAIRILTELGDNFTGRIIGTIVFNNKPFDITMLIEKGSIVAASLNSERAHSDKLASILLTANDGFLELQELDDAGVSLDKEFNADFLLDKPISLQSLRILEGQSKEGGEGVIEQTSSKADEAGNESKTGEPRGLSETGPYTSSKHADREDKDAMTTTLASETKISIDNEAVLAKKEEIERTITEVSDSAGPSGIQQTGLEAEATTTDSLIYEEYSLEKLLRELQKHIDPNAVDKCSEKLEANIINAYIAMVKAEKLLRRIKTSQLLEDILELINLTRDQDDYIRIVISLGEPDNKSPRYDLVLLALHGSIIALLLVDHNNPLEVLLSGKRVIEQAPKEVKQCIVLEAVAHIVSKQAIEPLLGCSQLVQTRERKGRRGLLSRLFGR